MRIYKRNLIVTGAMSIIIYTVAVGMEFYLKETANHLNFIINILVGIASSSLVVFFISITNFRIEKQEVMQSYFERNDELLEKTFFLRSILYHNSEAIADGDRNVFFEKDTLQEFNEEIVELIKILKAIYLLDARYEPIITYESKINFFKKRQKKKNKLIYLQNVFNSDCTEYYDRARFSNYIISKGLKTENYSNNESMTNDINALMKYQILSKEFEKNLKNFDEAVFYYIYKYDGQLY